MTTNQTTTPPPRPQMLEVQRATDSGGSVVRLLDAAGVGRGERHLVSLDERARAVRSPAAAAASAHLPFVATLAWV